MGIEPTHELLASASEPRQDLLGRQLAPTVASYASWLRRVAAQLIDTAIWVALIVVGWAIVARGSEITVGTTNTVVAIYLIGFLLYPWLMIGWRGQTLGMIVLWIRAVRASDAGRVGFGRALWRCVGQGLIGLIPFVAIADLLLPLVDARNQTAHDKLAATLVVLQRR